MQVLPPSPSPPPSPACAAPLLMSLLARSLLSSPAVHNSAALTGRCESGSAKWYQPLRVDKSFWPGQILQAELIKTDKPSRPAFLRAR